MIYNRIDCKRLQGGLPMHITTPAHTDCGGQTITSYKCIPYTPNEKRLSEMTIALVTTAGVHRKDQAPFFDNKADPDTSYRTIPGEAKSEQLTVTHSAPAFEYDTRAPKQDINTVFPLDRLRELAKDGFIGRSAGVHYSFMGYIIRLRKLIRETLPHFVEAIQKSQPDGVLLTAGCPYSHRAVVIIQRAIETQGIPTVLITVDPDSSNNYRPPRAVHPRGLPPGHSTGRPRNVSQQRKLVKTALTLLTVSQAPGITHTIP